MFNGGPRPPRLLRSLFPLTGVALLLLFLPSTLSLIPPLPSGAPHPHLFSSDPPPLLGATPPDPSSGPLALSPLSDFAPPWGPSESQDPRSIFSRLLLDLPSLLSDPDGLPSVFLAAMQAGGPPRPPKAFLRPLPPNFLEKAIHPTCDLNGDGVEDSYGFESDYQGSPTDLSGRIGTDIHAIDGKSGETLWFRPNLVLPILNLESLEWVLPGDGAGVDFQRYGNPLPEEKKRNAFSGGDFNGDGICDFVGIEFSYEWAGFPQGFVDSFTGTRRFVTTIHGISGKDGSDIWGARFEGYVTITADPTASTWSVTAMNFPTGALLYESPTGWKIVFKTSDILYQRVRDRTRITGVVTTDGNGYVVYSVSITDHVFLLNPHDSGKTFWKRDLLPNGNNTNITYVTGAVVLRANSTEPDIVLDQLVLTNPRGSELYNPTSGSGAFRWGKGMRMLALDGDPLGEGRILWTTTLLDPQAVRPKANVEENFEQLVWVSATFVRDVDGKGRLQPVGLYLAIEENFQQTINGAYRTHFVLLESSTGRVEWDVRQTGWGSLQSLRTAETSEPTKVALGLVDIPSAPPPGGRFPPKYVRIVVVDGKDGSVDWTYERRFAQNSFVIFNNALRQFQTALAPYDWDGDGLLDPVTPAIYSPPQDEGQILLSLSNHTYEILRSSDGTVYAPLRVWGPDGLVLLCPGSDPSKLNVISGYARRFDFTRYDVTTGRPVFRIPIWNNPAPRAASAGIDLLGVLPTCGTTTKGETVYSINAQLFSFDRWFEVAHTHGYIAPNGTLLWMDPVLPGNPPLTSIFAPYEKDPIEVAEALSRSLILPSAALGVAVGLLGFAALVFLERRRITKGVGGLVAGGAAVLLLSFSFLPTTLGSSLASVSTPSEGSPSLPPKEKPRPALERGSSPMVDALLDIGSMKPPLDPERVLSVVREYLGSSGTAFVPPSQPVRILNSNLEDPFEENSSMSYVYSVGDVTGDGSTDLALDSWCVDFDSCRYHYPEFPSSVVKNVLGTPFGSPHIVWVVDGKTGTPVWNRTLTGTESYVGPGRSIDQSFVLGVIPRENGTRTAILVYKFQILDPTLAGVVLLLNHTFFALDSATGNVTWSHSESGVLTQAAAPVVGGALVARSFLVNPILPIPPEAGVKPFNPSMEAALFLDGVGFDFIVVDSNGNFILAYEPREWAARIDLTTGEVLWRSDVYEPRLEEEVSELPFIMKTPPFRPYGGVGVPSSVQEWYWSPRLCCLDATGDGVPDLLYQSYTWDALPGEFVLTNHPLGAHLKLVDGATGKIVWSEAVDPDVPLEYSFSVQPAGWNAQCGCDNFLLQEEYYDFDYRNEVSLREGKDNRVLWNETARRALVTLPVGDADRDGVADFLLLDWYGYVLGAPFPDFLITPAKVPLVLRSGASGAHLWTRYTYEAPLDSMQTWDSYFRNGFPDLDGDGVADVSIDRPEYLGDSTVVHRQTLLSSGRNASEIYTLTNVGSFSVLSLGGDMSGTGRDGLVSMSGDLSDLWLTGYDGATGKPLWSRRILALPSSDSALALPYMRYIPLTRGVGVRGTDLLVNMHLYEVGVHHTTFGTGDFVGEFVYATLSIYPQILRFSGTNATLNWSLPSLSGPSRQTTVQGPTPATAFLFSALEETSRSLSDRALLTATIYAPPAGAFVLSGALTMGSLLAGRSLLRRRRNLSEEEVPDLD